MADTIKFYPYNILESGTVTVTGTADTGYPESRLYDRSINLLWKYTTGAMEIIFQVDQGGERIGSMGNDTYLIGGMGDDSYAIGSMGGDEIDEIKEVDLLYISGHNFNTRDMTWDYSDNGDNWTEQDSWTQDGNGVIIKTIPSSISATFWRVTVASHVNPQCAEIIMGLAYSFDIQKTPDPNHSWLDNVTWSQSIGGQERGIKLGNKRARRLYAVKLTPANRLIFQSVIGNLDGFSLPFLIQDMNDDYFMARFDPPPAEGYFLHTKAVEVDLNLVEML